MIEKNPQHGAKTIVDKVSSCQFGWGTVEVPAQLFFDQPEGCFFGKLEGFLGVPEIGLLSEFPGAKSLGIGIFNHLNQVLIEQA